MKTFCHLLIAGLVFALPWTAVHAQVLTSASNVKITAEASKPDADGKQTITLNFDVAKDWHLYANPVQNKELVDSQTTITFTAGAPLKETKIDYPAGTVHKDNGDTYNIYADKFVIKAQVVRAAGDSSPLKIKVAIQTCNHVTRVCLVPDTVELTVK